MLIPASLPVFFRKGSSFATGAATATLVASGANVNGIILRTFSMYAASGGGAEIRIGGDTVFYTQTTSLAWAGALFIPPGVALQMQMAGSSIYYVSWDLIP